MQSPKQLKKICTLIQENAGKMYAREIAEKAGCSYDVIRYYAKELGIDITAKHLIVDEKVKKIIELKDIPAKHIAERLGMTTNVVRYHLTKLGYEPISTIVRKEKAQNDTGYFEWPNKCLITGFFNTQRQ